MEVLIGKPSCNVPEQLEVVIQTEDCSIPCFMSTPGTPEEPGKFQTIYTEAGSKAMKTVEQFQRQQKKEEQHSMKTAGVDQTQQAKETMEQLEDTLPAILELARWAINERDITRTLKE
eukprot:scaffold13276_cov79-Cylindrotheca_fusiformis.AAC.3